MCVTAVLSKVTDYMPWLILRITYLKLFAIHTTLGQLVHTLFIGGLALFYSTAYRDKKAVLSQR